MEIMEIMPKTCSNLTKIILDKNQRNHPGVFISNSLFYTNCATFFIADFVCYVNNTGFFAKNFKRRVSALEI